ncbi:MAG TPA: malto-oligosyltrehalose synthase [Aggregatilineaceae bacterium]|nr:malto-oligosyltrehalose synthase [Aggregatilineaceae bacterium]
MTVTSSLHDKVQSVAQQLLASRRIPRATYRFQMNANFTFRDAAALVPYLHELGISDVYLSPILKSRPGSTHGYDICDYTEINPVLGTPDDFDALVAALQERGMSIMLDMVPNHMGVGQVCNTWWMDVLENGPSSVYAHFFDIDWWPVKEELHNKVLLPILEDQFGTVLEAGKFRLAMEEGAFFIYYGETKLPVTPDSYVDMLSLAVENLTALLDAENGQMLELQSILTALRNLPSYTDIDPEHVAERKREKEVIKRRLAVLCQTSTEVQDTINATINDINGVPGSPHSFDRIEILLHQQPYRPAFWRVAADEINYRRFFDINDMAAIHVELPDVFEQVHQLTFQLLAEGKVSSLRIDHPDGMWNPPAYFRDLQTEYLTYKVRQELEEEVDPELLHEAIQQWFDRYMQDAIATVNWPFYVVVEKILSETEPLPPDWPVFGTTGYDFMTAVNGIFVNSAHEAEFDRLYSTFVGHPMNFKELVYNSKELIMGESLSSEIRSLSRQLERITEASRRYRDFTLSGITAAIRQVMAAMSIYRTYITSPETVSDRDQFYILAAVLDARRRNPSISRLVFNFIRDTLLLRNLQNFSPDARPSLIAFMMRFQQLTGPVMAKSVEDTAFYIYNRLIALNEVGGHPEQFGSSLDVFHAQNQNRVQYWPQAMLSTSTHDTKRGEDTRARISVLSEIPQEWEQVIHRWSEMNAGFKTIIDESPAPSRNDEYLFYQTILGAWPPGETMPDDSFRERMVDYMVKAANESKIHSSWINPDEDYIAALSNFVRNVLDREQNPQFLDDYVPFQRRISYFGQFNSLSQTLLKLTSPGVPDIYQGSELWNLNLVDPDNRRPINYDERRERLADLKNRWDDQLALVQELVNTSDTGQIKLYVTSCTLQFRREHEALFTYGDYVPLEVEGNMVDHVCAFSRNHEGDHVAVIVPRLIVGLTHGEERLPLGDVWGDTRLKLPHPRYRNLLTGEEIVSENNLAQILSHFSLALLEPC